MAFLGKPAGRDPAHRLPEAIEIPGLAVMVQHPCIPVRTVLMKWFALAAVLLAVPLYAQIPGDKQLAFAEHLVAHNEPDAALIEYHRFIFHHPNHPKNPEALYEMGRLLLTVRNDIPGAKRYLQQLVDEFPGSKVGVAAHSFLDFVKKHSDFEGEPLFRWLKAKTAETNSAYKDAAEMYRLLVLDFPTAKISHDALYRHGMLLLGHLSQFNDAEVAFKSLIQNFPSSEWVPDAHLGLARVVEATEGSGREAMNAYRQVAETFPDTQVAREALSRMEAIQKEANTIARRYSPDQTIPYKITSLRPDDGRLMVFLEFTENKTAATATEIQASLEQALVRNVDQRAHKDDGVRVRAYYNYPFTEAGYVDWAPGKGDPVYKVLKRKNEDVLKDALFELMRR